MKTVAIIPARGGSKGIPRKNLKKVAGKPLIAYCIEAAQEAVLVEDVFVSTEDEEIANVAKQYGAKIIQRPNALASDLSSSEDALLHALEEIKSLKNELPKITVFLQCTSPLTTSEDINGTIRALLEQEADTALSVSTFHHFIWKRNSSGDALPINHLKTERKMRQEMPPQYLENGAVYVMKTDKFQQLKHRFFGKTALYEMPQERSFEIDDSADLKYSEYILGQTAEQTSKSLALPDKIGAIIFDFDGVFTDNKVYISEVGQESVRCCRGDGMGIAQLKKRLAPPMLILSSEINKVVLLRGKKLKIQVIQSCCDKKKVLKEWASENNIDAKDIIYVGNDINDLECMQFVGCAIAPANAVQTIKNTADIVLSSDGGEGAIREFTDLLLEMYEQ